MSMAPPLYADLGKKANDVFNKGYHFGLLKLDCKTKTAGGVELSTGGNSNQDSGKVFGSLETKYKVKDPNVTFTERWTTDNNLFTEVSAQDYFLNGLKTAGNVTFQPPTGAVKGQIKLAYNQEKVALNADFDVDKDKPLINAAAVVGHQGWLAGYQAAFDVNDVKLTKNNFALGFQTTDFTIHTSVECPMPSDSDGTDDGGENENENDDGNDGDGSSSDGQIFKGSFYQKISPKLESAVQIAWKSDNQETQFGLGTSYIIDQDASLRAKVDNKCLVGLGYQQRLREGVVLTLSLLVDGQNFNSGGHKVGMALELEG
ncbi:voltage-dependent anion-selective channel-like isoform X2 [Aethina tumida]|uniref:voltage-dependent anion-selective channel-like isoform X2 n=1 Tax=Aethina tumida TaxID=116153 RepID=UPI0021479CBB|nr:voltage-dependent anion-selective channel-like isoform X2 [Aethina tumida]